jgi:hypothetical protein
MNVPEHNTLIALVREYLSAMEVRDLDRAQALVAADAEFIFPGGRRLAKLGEIVAGSKRRYRQIGKMIDSFDVLPRENGGTVWCYGTLYGEWIDGTAFSGIRFIDRFEIVGGQIVSQRVWNDAGEIAAARRATAEGHGI